MNQAVNDSLEKIQNDISKNNPKKGSYRTVHFLKHRYKPRGSFEMKNCEELKQVN